MSKFQFGDRVIYNPKNLTLSWEYRIGKSAVVVVPPSNNEEVMRVWFQGEICDCAAYTANFDKVYSQ